MSKPTSIKDSLVFMDTYELMRRVSSNWMPPEFLNISPEKYGEKYVRIKTEDDLLIPFRQNPVQRIYRKLKDAIPKPKATGKRILTLKARRMGITTHEQVDSYALCRTRRNTKCLTIAQTKEDTQTIFDMVLRMHQDDPNFAKLDKDRRDALSYKVLRSEFSIATAKGDAVARGAQYSRVHGSEVAFWELNERDMNNLVAALGEAARKGEMVFESTANGLGGWFYDRWQEASAGQGLWHPIFLGWYLDSRNQVSYTKDELEQLIDTLEVEEAWLVERFSCNPGQLLWRREKQKGGLKLFKQEYPSTPEEAFIASGTGYFALDTLDIRLRQCKAPIRDDGGGLCVWKNPEPGRRYVIGVDTSEGNSTGDDTPICVLDWETGEQVLRLNWKAKPNVLGHRAVEIAKQYNGALIAVEMNNTGHSVLNTIMNQDMYNNIYWHEDAVKDDPKESKTPGWRTDAKTRPLLLSELDEAIEKRQMIVNDKLFLSQCKVFRDNGKGKNEVSRGTGSHGDLIFGWGIAWQARKMKLASSSLIILGD